MKMNIPFLGDIVSGTVTGCHSNESASKVDTAGKINPVSAEKKIRAANIKTVFGQPVL